MNISDLIKSGASITLSVCTDDLKEFARTVAHELKEELKPEEPKRYTPKEVMEICNYKSATTLWAREKAGIIKGHKDGHFKYYSEDEVNKLRKKQ